MSGKANKLKINELTSVDLVKRGANPDADICLFKSADGTDLLPPDDRPIAKRLFDALKSTFAPFLEEEGATDDKVTKDARTFAQVRASQEMDDVQWKYTRAFNESINSILTDGDLDAAQKNEKLQETLVQFTTTMQSLFPALLGISKSADEPGDDDNSIVKGDDVMKFDNVNLEAMTAEEKATFTELAKKYAVEGASADPAAPGETPVVEKGAPAAETPATPEANEAVTKALGEIEDLKKNYQALIEKQEKNAMLDVAKKYAPLGKKPEELAETLYTLKKSGEANYNAYVQALDDNLAIVNKSGLFTEIGKSGHGDVSTAGGAYAKAESIAKGFMQENPGLTYNEAMVKAWESDPALVAEYEAGN